MCYKDQHQPVLANQLATLIIKLHEMGYTEDFFIDVISLQLHSSENRTGFCSPYVILDVEECYDKLTHRYKYVQTVETSCGMRGILLTNSKHG